MARNVSLVWQPARWVAALRPRWVALEQVPAVLPLWEAMARALEVHGYRCWTGVLSAERYGVPQTRKRAILLASLDCQPQPPEATHQAYVPGEPARAAEPDLFGPGLEPWLSMAEALGWGMTERPTHTVTSGGTGSGGGVETFGGSDVRRVIERERGRWRDVDPDLLEVELNRGAGMTERYGERRPRRASEPAPVIRGGAGGGCGPNLTVKLVGGTGTNATERDEDEPAPTVHFGERANGVKFVQTKRKNATERNADEPAPTITGGHSVAEREWVVDTGNTRGYGGADPDSRRNRPIDEPAPAITSRADQLERRVRDPDRVVLDRRQTDGHGTPVGPRKATEPAPAMGAQGLAKGRDVWRDDADDPDAGWNRDDLAEGKRERSHLDAKQTGMPPRSVEDPAPTLCGGKLAKDTPAWVDDRPAPTLTGSRRSKDGALVGRQLPAGEREDVGGWPDERPATTVAGDPRVFPPGHKVNADDLAAGRGGQLRSGAGHTDGTARDAAVRVSVLEAALLQSFPDWWPWAGTQTSRFQQVGNAIPPLLARALLCAAMGRDWRTSRQHVTHAGRTAIRGHPPRALRGEGR
jgi:site-specific DNA-cytosine methylase